MCLHAHDFQGENTQSESLTKHFSEAREHKKASLELRGKKGQILIEVRNFLTDD